MKIIAGLLIIAGLVLGPGYGLYCAFFSGKKLGSYPVAQSGNAFRNVSLDLDPAMNPLGFNLGATVYHDGGGSPSTVWYTAFLHKGREQQLRQLISLSSNKGDRRSTATTTAVGTFSVPAAGNYQFSLTQGGMRDVKVEDISLEVRRNIRPMNMKVIWTGVGLLVAGFLFGVLFGGLEPAKPGED